MDSRKKRSMTPNVESNRIPLALHEEIIPRLLMAHRQSTNSKKATKTGNDKVVGITRQNIEELNSILLDGDVSVARQYLQTLLEDKISVEEIYLDLLQPIARKLGVCWENDSLDFTTITLAVWHINKLMYDLSPEFFQSDALIESKSRILLFPSVGSQHTLGLFMLAEFFRKSGWSVLADPAYSEEEIFTILSENCIDVVGISIGSYDQKNSTKTLINDIRKTFGSNLKIIIGGPLAFCEKSLFKELQADGQASDARKAVSLAESLVSKKKISA